MLRRLFSRRRVRAAPVSLVLYTRRDCPLCDEMKAELARARPALARVGGAFELREVDVDADAELAARHGRSVPVLEIAGRVAFEGRVTAADLERALARHADERPGDAPS